MAQTYDIGDKVRVQGTLTDSDGVAADPDTIAATVKSPAGTTTSYSYPATITKSATGIYYVDVEPTVPGKWLYRFTSTGNGKAAETDFFIVEESEI